MTNSLPPRHGNPPTDNKPLLWILAIVAAIVIIVVVLSASCRATNPNAPEPTPQTSVTTNAVPSPAVTSASPVPVITSSPLETWPSETAKANYLSTIAAVDPSMVGSQASVDALLRLGISTCRYLDEAVRISNDEQAIVLSGMEAIVTGLTSAGIDKNRAIKAAAIVINASVTTMCPEHRALVAVAVAPEATA